MLIDMRLAPLDYHRRRSTPIIRRKSERLGDGEPSPGRSSRVQVVLVVPCLPYR